MRNHFHVNAAAYAFIAFATVVLAIAALNGHVAFAAIAYVAIAWLFLMTATLDTTDGEGRAIEPPAIARALRILTCVFWPSILIAPILWP